MAAVWFTADDQMPRLPTHRATEAFDNHIGEEWKPWAGICEMREQTRAGKGEILLLNMPILVFVSEFHICPIFHRIWDLGFIFPISEIEAMHPF